MFRRGSRLRRGFRAQSTGKDTRPHIGWSDLLRSRRVRSHPDPASARGRAPRRAPRSGCPCRRREHAAAAHNGHPCVVLAGEGRLVRAACPSAEASYHRASVLRCAMRPHLDALCERFVETVNLMVWGGNAELAHLQHRVHSGAAHRRLPGHSPADVADLRQGAQLLLNTQRKSTVDFDNLNAQRFAAPRRKLVPRMSAAPGTPWCSGPIRFARRSRRS
jgi:hypothetical protein